MKRLLAFSLGAFIFMGPAAALASTYYPYSSNYTPAPYGATVASNCSYTYSPLYASSYTCTGDSGTGSNYYTPNYYPNQYYPSSAVVLTSLSPNTAPTGSTVTIYGSGFDSYNNTVYFGNQPLQTSPSYNGTSLSFVVPSYTTNGTYTLYVTNSRGTSNSLSFVVQPYGYNYNNTYGCSYYNNCTQYTNPYGAPTVSYLTPNSGAVGTSVGIIGSGFSATGNAVHFGNGIIANLVSTDGTTLGFTVPSQLSGYGSQQTNTGVYNVSVSNASGAVSNAVPFTVTGLGIGSGPAVVTVTGPSSLSVNTTGTWTLSVNNQSSSYLTASVSWGDNGLNTSSPQTIYAQGQQVLSFTHLYSYSGTYSPIFTITNTSGIVTSAPATVTVYGSGNYGSGNTYLSYVSPVSGSATAQLMLVGSGFSPTDNTVHFGIGGTRHIPSQNGSTIYYTIPYFVSACDISGPGCAAQAQQVFAGSYPIYVTNSLGTTNTLSVQVQ